MLCHERTSFWAGKKKIKEIVLLTASLPRLQGQGKPQNHTVKELQTPRLCCDRIKPIPQPSQEGGAAMTLCVGKNILLAILVLNPVVSSMQTLGLRQA